MIDVEVVKGPVGFLALICTDGRCTLFSEKDVQTSAHFRFKVTRFVPIGNRWVDCAERPGRCVLRIINSGQSDGDTPLTFDASVPAPHIGAGVSPDQGLRAEQLVKVSGTMPALQLAIALCPPVIEINPSISCPELGTVAPDDNGAFSIDVRVARILIGKARDFDCAIDVCSLRLYPSTVQYAIDPPIASFSLSFDAGELARPPAVHLSTNLVRDATQVTVTGENFADGHVSVTTCEKDVDIRQVPCSNNLSGGIVAYGTFSVDFRIEQVFSRRLIGSMEYRRTDCAAVPCVLSVRATGAARSFDLPLTFASS